MDGEDERTNYTLNKIDVRDQKTSIQNQRLLKVYFAFLNDRRTENGIAAVGRLYFKGD